MEGTNGKKSMFSVLATTTPKLLVDAGSRQCVIIYNNTPGNIYIGVTGSNPSTWMSIPTNAMFPDLFSSDDWWVATPSSSGTVSGFVVS